MHWLIFVIGLAVALLAAASRSLSVFDPCTEAQACGTTVSLVTVHPHAHSGVARGGVRTRAGMPQRHGARLKLVAVLLQADHQSGLQGHGRGRAGALQGVRPCQACWRGLRQEVLPAPWPAAAEPPPKLHKSAGSGQRMFPLPIDLAPLRAR